VTHISLSFYKQGAESLLFEIISYARYTPFNKKGNILNHLFTGKGKAEGEANSMMKLPVCVGSSSFKALYIVFLKGFPCCFVPFLRISRSRRA